MGLVQFCATAAGLVFKSSETFCLSEGLVQLPADVQEEILEEVLCSSK